MIRWCRIHGKPDHQHVLVCNACLWPLAEDGSRQCQARCNGPSYARWRSADQQDTWRCVEGLV